MCDVCEDWDAREPRQAAFPPPVAHRAREIERGLPGAPVPAAVWQVALGRASGAIAWADHQRILSALAAAAEEARAGAFASRRRGGRFACDDAG